MNIIKAQFIRDGEPTGKEYAYKTALDIPIGLTLSVKAFNSHKSVKVTNVITPEESEAYISEIKELDKLGHNLDSLVEITGQDLVVTAVKAQEL